MRWLTVTIEVLLFSGFIWALAGRFVKAYEVKRWELQFIKVSGIAFVISHLTAALLHPVPDLALAIIGTILLLASFGLFFWTLKSFKQPPAVAFADAIIAPLNTSGPYRFIRHPFYTSYLMAWLGGTFATGCWWLILTFLSMCVIYWKAASEEERQWLSGKNEQAYRSYMQKTGKFFIKLPKKLW